MSSQCWGVGRVKRGTIGSVRASRETFDGKDPKMSMTNAPSGSLAVLASAEGGRLGVEGTAEGLGSAGG